MHSFRPALLLMLCLATLAWTTPVRAETPVIPCKVLAAYPHNPGTFTQGLFFHDGVFYESSGGYGRSFLAMMDPASGHPLKTETVAPELFAEGIAPSGENLRMLTWKSGIGQVYTLKGLMPVHPFAYRATAATTEGWGLASDGKRFIMSTGKSRLEWHDAKTFDKTGELSVTDDGQPVHWLNELEFVGEWLYANIWKSDRVAIIDVTDGKVQAWLDLSPLRERLSRGCGVANGIAYDAAGKRLYVTGKNWDQLFEIEIPKLR
ncbi:glutaminyl-peptide cyclotransferase [uncultured Pseudodesulfovibrio sp.]|uniref:glutaminyl-peptide cyclotransferase n=1 Tax=uncultured Pseudodesulfovibrio sp. TaxID=2035858 RepID=UPI0029C65266|nr:glutaminyl-peptide cyclotransferase [uncultured Pseudodesulfovibrio sp.]